MDEEQGDTLVNVNIIDEERVERNLKNLREVKAGGYNPYEEEIDPLTGDLSRKGESTISVLLNSSCFLIFFLYKFVTKYDFNTTLVLQAENSGWGLERRVLIVVLEILVVDVRGCKKIKYRMSSYLS